MNYPQLVSLKTILMARLGDVKKGPAWQRRVARIQELFEDMLGHIRETGHETADLRNALREILEQLPPEANATSAGYGRERGKKFYLRKLSIESVDAARHALAKARP